MRTDQLDLPALPILAPLGAMLMIASALVLGRRGRLTPGRLAAGWLSGWYAVAVLGATMLPLHLAWGPGAGEPAFDRIILLPLVTMRVGDFLLNIVMTLPLAAVLRVVLGVREKGRVVLAGFLLSASIEVTQAILDITLHSDRWADVNDLTSNTLGALLGFLVFRRFLGAGWFRGLVQRISWERPRSRAESLQQQDERALLDSTGPAGGADRCRRR